MANEIDSTQSETNRGSGKRIILACLLTAALGLMLCPPWLGAYHNGHRMLWNGRGNLDWSRLALELCLVAIVGALAAVVAPMFGRPSARTLKVWLHRASLVSGCAALLTLASVAGYDVIARLSLERDFDRKVQDFKSKAPLLRQGFPLDPALPLDSSLRAGRFSADGFIVCSISNIHEAEFTLRRIGWRDSDIQSATAQFLSASVPESYSAKTLRFLSSNEIAMSGTKGASFEFYIRDADAARRFFAPLPVWYTEALQHNIEVARVPDWMKPGDPPAEWSFTDWLGSRTPWLILVTGMLALSALCFVLGSRIDMTTADTNRSVGGVRSGESVL